MKGEENMRVKNYNIKDKMYLLELIDKEITRFIITDENYSLSFELLTLNTEDYKKFDVKSYVKTLNYNNLMNYLQDINDTEDDYLINDNIDIDKLILNDM